MLRTLSFYLVGILSIIILRVDVFASEVKDLQIPLSAGNVSRYQVAWCYRAESIKGSPGHAFLAIGEWSNDGKLKSRIYGFYPEGNDFFGTIYGPGKVTSTPEDVKAMGDASFLFQKQPGKAALPDGSCRILKHVDQAKFQELEKQFEEWDKKNYHLGKNNCVSMMDAVAKAVGLKTPKSSSNTLPRSYVLALWDLNGGGQGEVRLPAPP